MTETAPEGAAARPLPVLQAEMGREVAAGGVRYRAESGAWFRDGMPARGKYGRALRMMDQARMFCFGTDADEVGAVTVSLTDDATARLEHSP